MTTVIPRRIAWELEYEMKSDAEKLADAYAGVNLLMRAIEHRRRATPYAARPESYLMWDKIRDLQELVEAITRRMPKGARRKLKRRHSKSLTTKVGHGTSRRINADSQEQNDTGK